MTKTTFFLLLLLQGATIFGYRFSCLEFQGTSCECDTDEELIDCNGRGWTKFPRLKSRLRGFSVMTLAFNDISGPLPSEADVLRRLPDLELLDLRGNNKLSCDEILAKFDRVNVHSHCIEKELAKERTTTTAPQTTAGSVPKHGKHPKDPRRPKPKVPSEPEARPRPLFPNCSSLWCRLENGVSTTYSRVYLNVHRVWTKMRNQFHTQHRSVQKALFSILP